MQQDEGQTTRGEKWEQDVGEGENDTKDTKQRQPVDDQGFMGRVMIYGTIVENKSHGSKDM